jgi:hypothetical protein
MHHVSSSIVEPEVTIRNTDCRKAREYWTKQLSPGDAQCLLILAGSVRKQLAA